LQKKWLDQEDSPELAIYVVWSSQLNAEEKHVADAAKLLSDQRAWHYWDGDQVVGSKYQNLTLPDGEVIEIASPAWDVWMLFGRDARWDESAPRPDWWEHQLGPLPKEIRLEPERFGDKASELLALEP
jgi:hypothetical protein